MFQIECAPADLAQAIASVERGCYPSAVKPVLGMVKVTADREEGILFEATDLNGGIRRRLEKATVQDEGAILIHPALVGQYASQCRDELLTLAGNGSATSITTFRTEWEMPAEDVGLFPPLAEIPSGPETIEVNQKDLHRVLNSVLFAARNFGETAKFGSSDGKAIIILEVEKNLLRAIGTDLKHLAVAEVHARVHHSLIGFSCMVPVGSIRMLLENLESVEELAMVLIRRQGHGLLSFSAKTWDIIARLAEGRSPPWKKIIPTNPKGKITADGDSLSRAFRQAAIFANQEYHTVRLSFTAAVGPHTKEGITFDTLSRTGERSQVDLDCNYQGPDLSIAIDVRYPIRFLEASRHDQATEVTIEITSDQKPLVFRRGPKVLFIMAPLDLKAIEAARVAKLEEEAEKEARKKAAAA
ncbi:hypothetical protein KIH39_26415 [Telmatocola sphagniphila]|uniref:Beta sliding clamp n=1 Tax=Telmatocola sphagniphila TaxID=1123043 RepID=A0A8E6B6E9_9BACT|nr:DNA polymerase III subunit beta [Telmatocola sphagniphila]QVL32324.1 hypothetical protein KIH39_26415 [Telmatocola sphagniphila]